MGIRNTVLDDYRSTDGTETVTLTHYNADGTETATAVTRACRESLALSEISASNGQYDLGAIAFHLSDDQIAAGAKPAEGDKITDSDSVAYYVVTATLDELKVTWRCGTNRGR